jgi:fatty-acyl-CoA synthase
MTNKIPDVDLGIGSILTRRAFLDPGREAIVFQDRRVTYKQLDERSNAVGNKAVQFGIKRGDRVGILMSNCNEYLEIFFGIAKIGAIAVHINTRLAPREIEFVLVDSGVNALFYGTEFLHLVDQVRPGLKAVRTYVAVGDNNTDIDYHRDVVTGDMTESGIRIDPSDNLMIMYTSGTTGRPKGALMTHKNALFASMNVIFGLHVTECRPLISGPLFHVSGLGGNAIPSIFSGGTLVMLSQFDAERALQAIEKERCTFMTGVPLFIERMLKIQMEKAYRISSLEMMQIGGGAIPGPLVRAWLDYGVRLVEIYGMTEVGSLITLYDDINAIQGKEGSAGKVALFINVNIVDAEGREIRDGGVGEILLNGESVIKGYWNRPEENEVIFKDGWLSTGDLGRMDEDGFLYIVGRKKDMIKSGGENVYPAELELVILEHSDIEAASIVGIPDQAWGEAVCAAIVMKKGRELSEGDFIDYCKANMARFKVPKKVKFVHELPRNVTGKVLKQEVKELFLNSKSE